jgi:hypothetical protein
MDRSEKATRNQPSAASFDLGFSTGGTALIVVEKAIKPSFCQSHFFLPDRSLRRKGTLSSTALSGHNSWQQ